MTDFSVDNKLVASPAALPHARDVQNSIADALQHVRAACSFADHAWAHTGDASTSPMWEETRSQIGVLLGAVYRLNLTTERLRMRTLENELAAKTFSRSSAAV